METATKEGGLPPKVKKKVAPIVLRAEELKQLDDIKLETNARSRPEVIRALIHLYRKQERREG